MHIFTLAPGKMKIRATLGSLAAAFSSSWCCGVQLSLVKAPLERRREIEDQLVQPEAAGLAGQVGGGFLPDVTVAQDLPMPGRRACQRDAHDARIRNGVRGQRGKAGKIRAVGHGCRLWVALLRIGGRK